MIENQTKRAAEIMKRLKKEYPEPVVELDYSTPFESLVASVLAAQNRDTNINKITPTLFRKCHHPADYHRVDSSELEQGHNKIGFPSAEG